MKPTRGTSPLRRREFLSLAATTLASATVVRGGLAAEPADEAVADRVPLGLDAHSLRGMRWKATQLIDFAAEQRLDAVLLNNLDYFESLEPSHLLALKRRAAESGIRIHVGAGGICANAAKFSDKWGNAEELLATGVRVATSVGSPTLNVRIGSIEDRFLKGGIQPRIDEAVRVLKASRTRVEEAGLKVGFENHAADLRSDELIALIDRVGTDVCGVMLDPGNGLWAMEDPMQHLEKLAPHVVCNSLRDYVVWESEEGATFRWTALGDGLMDVPAYVKRLARANPAMPLFVETISNSNRPIPFLTDAYWAGYPNLKAADIVPFLALCRRGRAVELDTPPNGTSRAEFEREHQRAEFLRSIAYLRANCRAGRKRVEGAGDSDSKASGGNGKK